MLAQERNLTIHCLENFLFNLTSFHFELPDSRFTKFSFSIKSFVPVAKKRPTKYELFGILLFSLYFPNLD